MKDFTQGSLAKHVLTTAAPVAVSMVAYIAYQIVDLYFVTKVGVAATAGVNAAGSVVFIVNALTEALGVGTAALVAHAVGRKDAADANLIFNQAMGLAIAAGAIVMTLIYALIQPYLRFVAADRSIVDAGTAFVFWLLPGSLLSLPMAVISAALRGTGVVRPAVAAYILTVLINAALAPVLVMGWGTGVPLGVRGAGLATTLSILVGATCLALYFRRSQRGMAVTAALMRPLAAQWRRILRIGLPAGGEFVITFLSAAVVYYAIRDLGGSVQAGFGIGTRVLQVLLLPSMVVAFAAAPVAGQNFGARNGDRVRGTFHSAALLAAVTTTAIAALVQLRPTAFVRMCDADAATLSAAATFLQLISWGLVAQALVFTCATMFQGLGNTMPALMSSVVRLVLLAIPATWLSARPSFRVEHVWYVWVASVLLQAAFSLRLLALEFERRVPRAMTRLGRQRV
jgi:MATE family, multidrug efflux pump